jgi:drug/metabolite transporter (DMT)-like permease
MRPDAPGVTGWSALGFLALGWGSAFVFISLAVETIAPSLIVLFRLCLASGMLWLWMLVQKKQLPPLSDRRWRWYAGLGLFGNAVPFVLVATAQQTIASGTTGILMGVTPLVIVVAAHFLLPNERLNWLKSLGFVTGFTGIVLLMGPSALTGLLNSDFVAQFLVVFATCCYATNAIMYQKAPKSDPVVTSCASVVCASIMVLPFAGIDWFFGEHGAPSLESMFGVFILGLIPTALATIVYMGVAKQLGAGFVALINLAVPIVAALIGTLIGENLGWMSWLALLVILSGIVFARLGARSNRPS